MYDNIFLDYLTYAIYFFIDEINVLYYDFFNSFLDGNYRKEIQISSLI